MNTKKEKSLIEPDEALDNLAYNTIGAAIEVHRTLGPGFRESSYEKALCLELGYRKIAYQAQAPIKLNYKGADLGIEYVDILVAGRLVIELKAVSEIHPVHRAQLTSYLKAMNVQLGLLFNFNSVILKDGIERIINPYYFADSLRQRVDNTLKQRSYPPS